MKKFIAIAAVALIFCTLLTGAGVGGWTLWKELEETRAYAIQTEQRAAGLNAQVNELNEKIHDLSQTVSMLRAEKKELESKLANSRDTTAPAVTLQGGQNQLSFRRMQLATSAEQQAGVPITLNLGELPDGIFTIMPEGTTPKIAHPENMMRNAAGQYRQNIIIKNVPPPAQKPMKPPAPPEAKNEF